MRLDKLIKRAVSGICVLTMLTATAGYAEIVDGNEVYGWSAASVKVPTVVPFSMDFNDPEDGTLTLQVASAEDKIYCTDMVCISNTIYAPDIYYDLKDQSNGKDGYVALEYVYNPATPQEAMKFKNEFYILNIPATKSNFTVDFELYNDGNADDITMRTHRFCGYNEDWMNLSAYLEADKWQRIALTFMDTSVTLYVDGVQRASVSRTINSSETSNAWVYLGTNFTTGEARTSLTAIDNMRIYEGGFKAVNLEDYKADDGSWAFKANDGFEIKQELTAVELKQRLLELDSFGKMYNIQIVDSTGNAVSDEVIIEDTHKVRIQPVSYNKMYVDYSVKCNIMLKNVQFHQTDDGVSVSAFYTNTENLSSPVAVLTVWNGSKMKDITVFNIENVQTEDGLPNIKTDCVTADAGDTVEFVIVNSLSQPYIISPKIYVK